MEKILIVVDMQKDFITGALGSPATQAVVEPIARVLAQYRKNGWQILYTADTHTPAEYSDALSQESKRIPRHCIKGEEGWEIVDALRPQPGERVVEKPSFGSLDLAREIGPVTPQTEIELCGVCTDICVVSNALGLRASFPQNKIAVLEDCCAGTSNENHKAALAVMQSCLVDIR